MMRKKAGHKGFTLAETLIVIIILALVTAAGAAATSSVLASRMDMIWAADAQTLGSTALQSIANEIRFGRDIAIGSDGSSITLDSATYGSNVEIRLSEDEDNQGKLTYGENNNILPDKAYNGLSITELDFSFVEVEDEGGSGTTESNAVRISLTVAKKDLTLWSGSYTVMPLNGKPDREESTP